MRKLTIEGPTKIRRAEHIFLTIGLALLAIWAGARLYSGLASRAAIARFQAEVTAAPSTGNALTWEASVADSTTDFTLWNPKRVKAYKDSLSTKKDLPLAILHIPKIKLEVSVFNDTDDLTLNRGVGRILGTAQIGQLGNLGIAGHRDGFFRGLKDIGLDDIVELVRPGRIDRYVITQVRIVSPKDVSVLAFTSEPSLTLVTCFPFYYVGNAPQRYVLTASYQTSRPPDNRGSGNSIFTSKKTNNKEKQNEVN